MRGMREKIRKEFQKGIKRITRANQKKREKWTKLRG